MASKIDLRNGSVSIEEKGREVNLSKIDLLLSRDSKDVNDLIVARTGTLRHTYYFRRDILDNGWECISGPRGMREPLPSDWPSAQRGR